jgi:hypothetical protein
MKACAERHVLEALQIQEKIQEKVSDEVGSALAFLQALMRCPGPNCNIPFEHSGEFSCCEKCTLSHAI